MENDWWVNFSGCLSIQEFERWNELKGELSRISLDYDSAEIVT
jgi:hypothetical protein